MPREATGPVRRFARGRRTALLVATVALVLVGTEPVRTAAAATTTTTRQPEPSVPTTGQPLPSPRPADFDATGSVSAFPSPGTPTASPTTMITFRGAVPPLADGDITVTGSESGAHPGHAQAHPDGGGATFVPDAPFAPGETVTVVTGMQVRGASNGRYSFGVARPSPFPAQPLPAPKPASAKERERDLLHFDSRPDLTPPRLTVTTPTDSTDPGDVFLTPAGGVAQPGLLIVDAEGQPIWDQPHPGGATIDLQVQEYQGRPVLTWYEGSVVDPGVGQGSYVVADSSYQPIARVQAVNGYAADLHDMTITPQGTALFTIYNPIIVDASSAHGAKQQRVLEPVIQEVDIATGTLLFEWHGLPSIALNESYQPVPKRGTDTFDYVHVNSVGLDHDGNLLVSGRHTWSVYKIDHTSGVLDWRLGGKKNSFTMPASATSAWQHDARANTDGTLSIFDNGAAGATKTHKTRGLVLAVDEQQMTATLRQSDPAPGKVESTSQGSFRLLADGNYLAGWGDQPEYSEFAPDGSMVYDVKLPSSAAGPITSYRAVAAPWTGHPTGVPAVAAHRGSGDEMTIAASWNGATDVAMWTVLAGPDRNDLTPVTSVPRHGFETTIHVTSNQPYVAAEALDANGTVLATSGAVTPRT
jgi:hypothetical protein